MSKFSSLNFENFWSNNIKSYETICPNTFTFSAKCDILVTEASHENSKKASNVGFNLDNWFVRFLDASCLRSTMRYFAKVMRKNFGFENFRISMKFHVIFIFKRETFTIIQSSMYERIYHSR